MQTSLLYREMAELCELMAEELPDAAAAEEWRLMAADWRAAALEAANDNFGA
jgi:hypothetical protein